MGSNSKREKIFYFKQFSVKDEVSAMKVGTDGVLVGAWANIESAKHILDIGSGCGLISLMTAQRSKAEITGVEIEPLAAEESKYNISLSPWGQRISIINDDINGILDSKMLINVDHIVSNPPFFKNGITAPDINRATARHCNTLDFDSLIRISKKLLVENGKLTFISPYDRKNEIISSVSFYQMFISRYCDVYAKQSDSIPTRILWEISVENCHTCQSKFAIRDEGNIYTSEYVDLTRLYYLNF